MTVGDLPGQLDLVAEALDDLGDGGDLGLEELESDDLADLAVVSFVDGAHAALADLLDDLEAAGEGRAPIEALRGRLERGRPRRKRLARAGKLAAAAAAETGPFGIVVQAARALHGMSRLSIKNQVHSSGPLYIKPVRKYARRTHLVSPPPRPLSVPPGSRGRRRA